MADPFCKAADCGVQRLSAAFYCPLLEDPASDVPARLCPTAPQARPGRGPSAAAPGTPRAVLVPVAVVLLIGTLFVSVYLAAFHAPHPRAAGGHHGDRHPPGEPAPGPRTRRPGRFHPGDLSRRVRRPARRPGPVRLRGLPRQGGSALRQCQWSRRHRHRDHRVRLRGPRGTRPPLRRGRRPASAGTPGGCPSSTRPSAWYWPDTSSA